MKMLYRKWNYEYLVGGYLIVLLTIIATIYGGQYYIGMLTSLILLVSIYLASVSENKIMYLLWLFPYWILFVPGSLLMNANILPFMENWQETSGQQALLFVLYPLGCSISFLLVSGLYNKLYQQEKPIRLFFKRRKVAHFFVLFLSVILIANLMAGHVIVSWLDQFLRGMITILAIQAYGIRKSLFVLIFVLSDLAMIATRNDVGRLMFVWFIGFWYYYKCPVWSKNKFIMYFIPGLVGVTVLFLTMTSYKQGDYSIDVSTVERSIRRAFFTQSHATAVLIDNYNQNPEQTIALTTGDTLHYWLALLPGVSMTRDPYNVVMLVHPQRYDINKSYDHFAILPVGQAFELYSIAGKTSLILGGILIGLFINGILIFANYLYRYSYIVSLSALFSSLVWIMNVGRPAIRSQLDVLFVTFVIVLIIYFFEKIFYSRK
jgi:hypothetical protein